MFISLVTLHCCIKCTGYANSDKILQNYYVCLEGYPRICLEGLGKIMENLSQDGW